MPKLKLFLAAHVISITLACKPAAKMGTAAQPVASPAKLATGDVNGAVQSDSKAAAPTAPQTTLGGCKVENDIWKTQGGGCKHMITGLIFSAISHEGSTVYKVEESNVPSYCSRINTAKEGGFQDWRLPTAKELTSVSGDQAQASLNNLSTAEITDWSSEIFSNDTKGNERVYVDLSSGKAHDSMMSMAHVFCVRK